MRNINRTLGIALLGAALLLTPGAGAAAASTNMNANGHAYFGFTGSEPMPSRNDLMNTRPGQWLEHYRGVDAVLNDVTWESDTSGYLHVTIGDLRAGQMGNNDDSDTGNDDGASQNQPSLNPNDDVSIHFNRSTQFTRRYGGVTTVDELQIGDKLLIVATYNAQANQWHATHVQDWSIWRKGVSMHLSVVTATDDDSDTLTVRRLDSTNNSTATVQYDDDTKVVLFGVLDFKRDWLMRTFGDEFQNNQGFGREFLNDFERDRVISGDSITVGSVIRVMGTARLEDGELTISDADKIWVKASADYLDFDEDDVDDDSDSDDDSN